MSQIFGFEGLLVGLLAAPFAAFYAFIFEPVAMLRVRVWRNRRPEWPGRMRIAILSDLHLGEPFVGRLRLRRVVAKTNTLGADLIVILGDMTPGHTFVTSVPEDEIAQSLSQLQAPMGVVSVLGNHDWWEDKEVQARGSGPTRIARELEAHGIPVLENDVMALPNGIQLAGLGDQLAFESKTGDHRGVDDLPGTLAQIPDGAPAILLAHEPDIFPEVPDRISLTLSGHTHGGQVRFFGWSPVVPSKYGNRYAYGPVREGKRDLIVSGGIGCSIFPVRIGMMPEITVVELVPDAD